MATKLEIRVLADTKTAIRQIRGFVQGIRNEFNKISAGAGGAGKINVNQLSSQIVASQNKISESTAKATKKAVGLGRQRLEMIQKIAKAEAAGAIAYRKGLTGVKATKEEYRALLTHITEHLNKQKHSNQELKKGVKLLDGYVRKMREAGKAGMGLGGATGAQPLSIARGAGQQFMGQREQLAAGQFIPKDAIKNMEHVRSFAADIGKYAKFQIRWFASAGIIFTIAGALSRAARNTIEFHQALKDIEAITAKSEEEIRLVGDAAKEVASTTPLAAAEAAKMGLKLVQAGLSARATAEAMKTVAAVTTVSGENMETVAKAVTTAMFAWNLEASRVPEIGNVLAGALNFSRLTVEDLGTAFNYLASTSAIMGRNLAETSAALAVLSNMGIRASTIGTGLSQLMTQLVAPTAKFGEELKRVGVSANDINPTMNKMSVIITRLRDAGFSAAKSMDILGVRAGRILAASIIATGEAFDDMEKKITKQNMLNDALKKSMEGPRNALMKMRNQLDIAVTQIGDVAVPAIVGMADVMGFLLQRFRDATAVLSFLAEKLTGLGAALALTTAAGIIPMVLHGKKLITMFKGLTIATISFSGALAVLAKHPYIYASIALIGALSALGAMFTRNKKKMNELALAKDKDIEKTRRQAQVAAELRAEQARLEEAVTKLSEAWDKIKDPIAKLPMVAKIREIVAQMDLMSMSTDAYNVRIGKLEKSLAGQVKAFDNLGKSAKESLIKQFSDQVKETTYRLKELKSEAGKVGGEIAHSFRTAFAALAETKPGQLAAETISGILGRSTTDELKALADYRKYLEKTGDALVARARAINKEHKAGTIDAKGLEKEMKKLLIDYKAYEEIANKVRVSLSKLTRRTKDYSNALRAAQKGVIGLQQKLADLKETDPITKIGLQTARDLATTNLTLLKFEEKRAKVTAKLNSKIASPEARVELLKQEGILGKIVAAYFKQLDLISETGNLRKSQAAEARKLDFGEIEAGHAKLKLEAEQKLLNIRKIMKTISPVEGLMKEVELENKKLNILIRQKQARLDAIRAEKIGSKDKDLEIARLELELAQLRGQKAGVPSVETQTAGAIPAEVSELLSMQNKLDQMKLARDGYLEYLRESGATEVEIARAKEEAKTQIEDQSNQMRFSAMQNNINMTLGLMDILYVASGSKNKKLFLAMKAAAFGQAIISAHQAAALALANPPGPPTTIPMAATALKMGYLNAGMIAAQTFASMSAKGGGSMAAGGGGGGDRGYKYFDLQATKYGTGFRPGEEQGATQVTYNINAVDAKSFKALVEENPSAITEVVQQDIKDNGKTKEVIKNYAA
jgi:TP901 family phage tail tape measure protein